MGSETPASAMAIDGRSKIVPRRNAEMTPMLTPTTSQITAAPDARARAVIGSRVDQVRARPACS